MMRVLHIMGELKPSGAETMLVTAAAAFAKEGIENSILSIGEHPGKFAGNLSGAGYAIHYIPFSKSVGFIQAVYRLIHGNFDAVHIHTEWANFWIGLAARLAAKGPAIRTVHSNFGFEGNLRWRRGLQRKFLEKIGVQHIGVSESVRKNEGERFGLRLPVVPNWYDSGRFVVPSNEGRRTARLKLGIADDAMVMVSVGNCSTIKNHCAVLQAIAQIPQSHRPIYLHVGMEEEGAPERVLARELKIESGVRFYGPADDVVTILAAADLFVMPSLFEGFGIAAVEAMASGLPCIFAAVPGLLDFRTNSEAILFSEPDGHSLARNIQGVLALSKSEREQMGRSGAESARRQYSIEGGVAKYAALYRSGDRVTVKRSELECRDSAHSQMH